MVTRNDACTLVVHTFISYRYVDLVGNWLTNRLKLANKLVSIWHILDVYKNRIIRVEKTRQEFWYACYLLVGLNLSSAGLQKCYDTGNFTPNSTYGLSSLPANVSRNDGFYIAIGLCRGDTSSDACSSCISLRSREIKQSCPNQTEALLWEGDVVCLIHYANHPISPVSWS